MDMIDLDNLSSKVIKAAINVHNELGPGLLESVYQSCMFIELGMMEIRSRKEAPVRISYRGRALDDPFRLDLLVEDCIIVELKSIQEIMPVHRKQLLTYLRLARKPLGLLINFNVPLLKEGIIRIINSPQNEKNPLARFA
jgi:GxxExxY protein